MKKNNEIPRQEHWGNLPADDLDVLAAYKDFFGKTNQEMEQSFANCVIEMADSLRWMPPVPFRYYLKGFADFILGSKFHESDAPDAASSFLRLIEEKVRRQPDFIAPIMEEILPVVAHLANNQSAFQADPDIYGDFSEKGRIIEELWGNYQAR